MKNDVACAILCKKKYSNHDIRKFKHMIQEEYRVHWMLDNLPVAVRNEEADFVVRGFPLGFFAAAGKESRPLHYLYNHVRIIVRYTESETGEYSGSRIVGFEVVPFSIKVYYYFTRNDCLFGIMIIFLT